jgi:uncharacterized protein (DUF433 family)
MAMPQPRVFPHIVRVPGVVGGEPTIKGTRVSVQAIVEYYRMYKDIERIHKALPHVSTAMIKEALAYYEANGEEIDGYIAEDAAEDDRDG